MGVLIRQCRLYYNIKRDLRPRAQSVWWRVFGIFVTCPHEPRWAAGPGAVPARSDARRSARTGAGNARVNGELRVHLQGLRKGRYDVKQNYNKDRI